MCGAMSQGGSGGNRKGNGGWRWMRKEDGKGGATPAETGVVEGCVEIVASGGTQS